MGSPFQVQPPQWLERIARPIDAERTGEIIGTGLAGAINAYKGDESLTQGIAEARLNQADPLWKQKFQVSMENARLGQQARWMQVQESGARLSVLDQTLKAKQAAAQDEADDQLAYSAAKTEVGNDALKLVNHTMPAFKSPKYRMMWQTDVNTAKNADSVVDRNNAAAALKAQNIKDESEFAKSLSLLTNPRDRVAIQLQKDPTKRYEMLADAQSRQQASEDQAARDAGLEVTTTRTGPRGTTVTRGEPKKTPLQRAQAALDELTAAGADEDAITAATKYRDKLTVSSLDTEAARNKDRLAYDAQRQKDRKELLDVAQGYRIDLEKLRESAKPNAQGKQISEQAFIDRHYTAVLGQVIKNWDDKAQGEMSTEKASAQAFLILKKSYRSMIPPAASAPASTNAATSSGFTYKIVEEK